MLLFRTSRAHRMRALFRHQISTGFRHRIRRSKTCNLGRLSTVASASDWYFSDGRAEPLEGYCKGGYHPVHLGDHFSGGRYRVVHKLGWGGFSTVWLAHDSQASRLVALKFVAADLSGESEETKLLQQLSTTPCEHSGRRHLSQLLDAFHHNGVNGDHQCLVLGVNCESVQTCLRDHDEEGLPGSAAWTISKQVVLALDFLHSNSIAHGGQSYD